MPFHVGAVFRNQKIAAWLEQFFGVVPRRTDERNATGERFEWTDRWDSRQEIYIGTPRHVQCDSKTRKDFRHTIVRQPTAVGNSRFAQHLQRVLRIPHAENLRAKAKRFDGLDQELA